MRFIFSPICWIWTISAAPHLLNFISANIGGSNIAVAIAGATPFDALDNAILNDLIEAYATHEPSTCNTAASAAATSFSFDWPGANSQSNWYASHVPLEHAWRDNTTTESPWVDEVIQSVAINLQLNQNLSLPQYCPGPNINNNTQCKKYFIHQAGAYQRDGAYTTPVPFHSPSLAKHCSGNSCIFASWGTSAHVPTPFTSPIIYINMYTNCNNGIIEHTQMIHNFANPSDPLSTALNVDQTFFDVAWGGVRSSSLPYALKPNPSTGTLNYADVNNVDYLPTCLWGNDAPGGSAGRAARTDLKNLGGYTSFVDGGLLVNQTFAPILPPCRKGTDPTCTNAATCMVLSCTDDQILNENYVRMELKVDAGSTPNCAYHMMWNGLVSLQCNMHDTGFGQTSPYLDVVNKCSPSTDIGLVNSRTGEEVLNVAFLRHWSYSTSNKRMYFAVYSTNTTSAINMVNIIFDNRGYASSLPINIVPMTQSFLRGGTTQTAPSRLPLADIPVGYDPEILNSFTIVYGKGQDYEGVALDGLSRRRIGSTSLGVGTRDYTVFTVNWYGNGARLQPGSTYVNRGFYFSSDLGSVQATANDLVPKTFADEIGLEQWSPRRMDIYKDAGSNFVVLAASAAGGTSTTCDRTSASLICSGSSTPRSGYVPFFHIQCGSSLTYFGPDPYTFTPSFGSRFPGHDNMTNLIRSSVCDGLDTSIRPTWKLMGFFNASNSDCISFPTATYNETVCDMVGVTIATNPPSTSPSISLTNLPTHTQSLSPTTPNPTTSSSVPSNATPTCIPSNAHTTNSPTTLDPTTAMPSSFSPSNVPTPNPTTPAPTALPTSAPTYSPTTNPTTHNPTAMPTFRPSTEPTTLDPTAIPTSSPSKNVPTTNPTTRSPTATPTFIPSNAPTTNPTTLAPTAIPTFSPSNVPTSNPTTLAPTAIPMFSPSNVPTPNPTTLAPTAIPTSSPSNVPTTNPTTLSPTAIPTFSPSNVPTTNPTTLSPTAIPTFSPSNEPTTNPTTLSPTATPTSSPSNVPTPNPTTLAPTAIPTFSPSNEPTPNPTTLAPTAIPTFSPSNEPTPNPTTLAPTTIPTSSPSNEPTTNPTLDPTSSIPSNSPTPNPTTRAPTATPTSAPSKMPSPNPTSTSAPTSTPTISPSNTMPTFNPTSKAPTAVPTFNPTTKAPSTPIPTKAPTAVPTFKPTMKAPTAKPTFNPTTKAPTPAPTKSPTVVPTLKPTTKAPTPVPTKSPTAVPTVKPTTKAPTAVPTFNPTTKAPTAFPTLNPTTKAPITAPADPTTQAPTTIQTKAPTAVPTLLNPTTKAPTAAPTFNPTTKRPTALPTNVRPTTKAPSAKPTKRIK
ncbi:hypothetical protein ACHAXH_007319 [Discostella pseudostelligera]